MFTMLLIDTSAATKYTGKSKISCPSGSQEYVCRCEAYFSFIMKIIISQWLLAIYYH